LFVRQLELACSDPDVEAKMAADEIFVMVLVLVCVIVISVLSVRSRSKAKQGSNDG
jgi:hypothetical protein